MKIATFQAPLLEAGSMGALSLMQERVAWCEAEAISILCCPEAILGGLADYSDDPRRFAIRTDDDELSSLLAPLASRAVTSIVGFTELAGDGKIYNAAAVYQHGRVAGIFRKLHPALRRSVYAAGSETPVFRAGETTFGVVICNDSNYAEPARRMAEQGATILFVPSNNALPRGRAYPEIGDEARAADIARATENGMWVVRADVAGDNGTLMSYGSSGIVNPQGRTVREARLRTSDTLVVEIKPVSMRRQ